jgi:hypothetical protein
MASNARVGRSDSGFISKRRGGLSRNFSGSIHNAHAALYPLTSILSPSPPFADFVGSLSLASFRTAALTLPPATPTTARFLLTASLNGRAASRQQAGAGFYDSSASHCSRRGNSDGAHYVEEQAPIAAPLAVTVHTKSCRVTDFLFVLRYCMNTPFGPPF